MSDLEYSRGKESPPTTRSIENKKPKDKRNSVKKKNNDFEEDSIKAIKYIAKIRQSKDSETAVHRLDKETEISQIGQSLQSRLATVMHQTSPQSPKKSKSSHDHEDNSSSRPLVLSRVDPKFLPQDLSKLPSVEVISILKRSILFNKGMYVTISIDFRYLFLTASSLFNSKFLSNRANFILRFDYFITRGINAEASILSAHFY